MASNHSWPVGHSEANRGASTGSSATAPCCSSLVAQCRGATHHQSERVALSRPSVEGVALISPRGEKLLGSRIERFSRTPGSKPRETIRLLNQLCGVGGSLCRGDRLRRSASDDKKERRSSERYCHAQSLWILLGSHPISGVEVAQAQGCCERRRVRLTDRRRSTVAGWRSVGSSYQRLPRSASVSPNASPV